MKQGRERGEKLESGERERGEKVKKDKREGQKGERLREGKGRGVRSEERARTRHREEGNRLSRLRGGLDIGENQDPSRLHEK